MGSGKDELSVSETRLVERISSTLQENIDVEKVGQIVSSNQPFGNIDYIISSEDKLSAEEEAAAEVLMERYYEEISFPKKGAEAVIGLEININSGLRLIEYYDQTWRFEPTIELIFELSTEDRETILNYLEDFNDSDYDFASNQQTKQLFSFAGEWIPEDHDVENIETGLEIYESTLPIVERTFPNLLALKRVLDGQDPDIDHLQRKKLSSIQRELTDEDQLNSAYFDLIVEWYDTDLRNAIAHGDLIHDAHEEEFRIPTENRRYSYSQFQDSIKQNLSNVIFTTRVYEQLLLWIEITNSVDSFDKDRLRV